MRTRALTLTLLAALLAGCSQSAPVPPVPAEQAAVRTLLQGWPEGSVVYEERAELKKRLEGVGTVRLDPSGCSYDRTGVSFTYVPEPDFGAEPTPASSPGEVEEPPSEELEGAELHRMIRVKDEAYIAKVEVDRRVAEDIYDLTRTAPVKDAAEALKLASTLEALVPLEGPKWRRGNPRRALTSSGGVLHINFAAGMIAEDPCEIPQAVARAAAAPMLLPADAPHFPAPAGSTIHQLRYDPAQVQRVQERKVYEIARGGGIPWTRELAEIGEPAYGNIAAGTVIQVATQGDRVAAIGGISSENGVGDPRGFLDTLTVFEVGDQRFRRPAETDALPRG